QAEPGGQAVADIDNLQHPRAGRAASQQQQREDRHAKPVHPAYTGERRPPGQPALKINASEPYPAQLMPLLILDDIRLSLTGAAGTVEILRGVSLTIAEGETVALVGPSGSGKSTLMMVMAGLERPSAGRVELAGSDLAALDEDGLARLRRAEIGIVFQAFHLLPTMTALENVAIPLELGGGRAAFAEAGAALERVGLGHRIGHYPGELSGG